jgi:hypothetical protein
MKPCVRESVPVTLMLRGPGGVPSPCLPRPSPYAQICLLLYLDETGVSPHHVDEVASQSIGSVYLVWAFTFIIRIMHAFICVLKITSEMEIKLVCTVHPLFHLVQV